MRKTLIRALAAALATTALVGIADAQTFVYRHKPALNAPISQADVSPDAFVFPAVSGAARNAVVTSAAVTPTGYNAASAVAVSGDGAPQLSLDGGATWAASGTLTPGGSIRLRLTTGATPATAHTVALAMGAATATWQVTTGAADTTPDAYTIAATVGATANALVTSAAVTPVGYTDAAPISVAGGGSPQISVAGGAWSASGTISPGQSFQVRLTANGTGGGTQTATVSVGGVQAGWTVTTRASGAQAFGYTGGAQSFTVPAGVTQVTAKVWGGHGTSGRGGGGGGGGYATGTFPVTPGETLTLEVGGYGVDSGYGGGACGTNNSAGQQCGGGRTSVLRGGTYLLIAGGGGGGGEHGSGGGGGGTPGNGTGGCPGTGGGSGSMNGYSGSTNAGGGGGGYRGGTAGCDASWAESGGGGGSGYLDGSVTGGSMATGGTGGGTANGGDPQSPISNGSYAGRVHLSW